MIDEVPHESVIALQDAFNSRMSRIFRAGHYVCLDESMSVWTNLHTMPGAVCIPPKPHPLGQEFRCLACVETEVIFSLDVVSPRVIQNSKQFADEHKLMEASVLRLVEAAKLLHSNRVIVGDSAFSQVSCMLELRRRGLYAIFNMKKRKTWPSHSFGDELDGVMPRLKEVGSCLAKTAKIDNVEYSIFTANLPFGQHTLMATCGKTSPSSTVAPYFDPSTKSDKAYYLPDVFKTFYDAAHAVDQSNQIRQAHFSIEAGWKTQLRWWIRSFSFFVALADANAYNISRKLLKTFGDDGVQQWRLGLAYELLGVAEHKSTLPETPPKEDEHELRKMPRHQQYSPIAHDFVASPTTYTQRRCQSITPAGVQCAQHTRTYCSCNISVPMCRSCFSEHVRGHVRADTARRTLVFNPFAS